MKLTWHIIAKDLRQDKWALGFWVLLFGLHLAVGSAFLNTDGTDLELIDQLRWGSLLLTIFEFTIGYLLALRWVQADDVSGTHMFWVTRPISGGRLFAAKATGLLLVFGLLPVLLWLPWWVNCGLGAREMGWLGVEMFGWQLLVIAPALLIGSLTDDFGRALMWSLLLVLAMIAWSIIGQARVTELGVNQFIRAYPGLWFSRLFVAGVLLVLGFVAIAANQFWTRNFVRSIVRVGVLALLVLGVGRYWVSDFSDAIAGAGDGVAKESIPDLGDTISLSVKKARLSTFTYKSATPSGPLDMRPLTVTLAVSGLPEDLVLGGVHAFQELRWNDGSAYRSPERNHSFDLQMETALRKRLALPQPAADPETIRWGQARVQKTNAERAAKGLPPIEDLWARRLQGLPPEERNLWIRFPVPDSTVTRLRSQAPGYATLMNATVARWDVAQVVPLMPGSRGTGARRPLRFLSRDDWVVRLVETTAAFPREGLFQSRVGRTRPYPSYTEIYSANQVTGDMTEVSGRNLVATAITVGGVRLKWLETTLTPARWIRNDVSVIKDPDWAEHTRLVVMTPTEVGRFTQEIRTDRLAIQFPPEAPAGTPAPDSAAGPH